MFAFLENVECLSRKSKQNTSKRFNRFYDVVGSTLNSESKDPSSNLGRTSFPLSHTEAKRCFATRDEDNDYFNMRIYIILIACVYIQQFNFIQ